MLNLEDNEVLKPVTKGGGNPHFSSVNLRDKKSSEDQPRKVERLQKIFDKINLANSPRKTPRKTPGKQQPRKSVKKTSRNISTPKKSSRKSQPLGKVMDIVSIFESKSGSISVNPAGKSRRKWDVSGKGSPGTFETGKFENLKLIGADFDSDKGDISGLGHSLALPELISSVQAGRLVCSERDQWERATQTGPRDRQDWQQIEGGDWSDRQGRGDSPPTTGLETARPRTSDSRPAPAPEVTTVTQQPQTGYE